MSLRGGILQLFLQMLMIRQQAVQYADVFYKVSALDVVGIEKIALAEKVDFYIICMCRSDVACRCPVV